MKEYRGSLGGRSWVGHVVERTDDLIDFMDWVYKRAADGTPVAVDTEGKGLAILSGDPEYIRLAQFGTETEAWTIPVELGRAFRGAVGRALTTLPVLTGHNFHGFDAPALAAYLGTGMDGLDSLCRKATDTMILSKLVDPRQAMEGGVGHGLKPLSAHYIDQAAPDTQGDLTAVFRSLKLTKATGWAGIDLFHPIYQEYACLDVILTSRLRPILLAELTRLGVRSALVSYEHDIARLCSHMQFTGMVLDQDYTRELSGRLEQDSEEGKYIALSYGVGSINSTKQLAEALMGMGEELTERTDNGAVKVDKAVLAGLADLDFQSGERLHVRTPNPLAAAVIKAKRAGKWRSAYAETFLETMDANGRIHPMIGSLAARTGRMSITRPALQTLPSSDWMIRRALLADEGHVMVSTDFQAIEMRVLAALADVQKMKEGFCSGGTKFDIHMYTAKLIKGEGATKKDRKVFKGAGFGKVYGGGVATIARQTGAPEHEIQQAVTAYDREFPEIKAASRRWQREAFGNGMVFVSATGRRLPLDRDRTYAVVNYACQSAARDVLGQAMLHMEEAGLLPYMRLPIHDEIVASVPKAEAADLAREFERCMTFDLFGVPVVAEAEIGGRSWGSLYGADS